VTEVGDLATDLENDVFEVWVDPGEAPSGYFPAAVAARVLTGPSLGPGDSSYLQLDPSGATIESNSLADVPFSLSSYQGGFVHRNFYPEIGGFVEIQGVVDALSSFSVPERGRATLVVVSLASMAALGFRRARS